MKKREAMQLKQWDERYIWHPFTQMKEWKGDLPLLIEKAKGNWLIDADGRRYLDGVSSLWCNVHGHRRPEIDRAIKKQIDQVSHSTFLGLSHVPAARLSKMLLDVAPKGLKKVFYSDSGSAAVEVALKMAYQYWQLKGRKKKISFLHLKNAYHGDTLGSVSVGGIDLFHDIFHPLLFKTFQADAPYRYRDSFRGSEKEYAAHCAAKVEAILKKNHTSIAALIVEPLMQGASGMLQQPKGYLRLLRRLADRYEVLLIADEVATGFGRTGKMFACEREGVTPDFLCLAKGITGGYLPLSATLTTQRVYDAFLGEYGEFKAFFHGHTYSANPLASAAAIASLEIFKNEKTIRQIQPKIKLLARELSKIAKLPHVGEVRQTGLMVGIELVKNKATKEPYLAAQRTGHQVIWRARKKGVIIRPLGNVIVLMPPLSITTSEIRKLCEVVRECIVDVTA